LPGRFSFNVKGGRCEACAGDGTIKIEMHFLPDVYVPCEVCKGARYNRDTLDITWKGKNIAEVLELSIEEALELFANQPSIAGHPVLGIEHNLDVVKSADWIIDLGPEGGDAGGRVVVEGTPEQVAKTPESHTGRYLAPILGVA